MKTILVTGGAGYIGSHACKALARAGWQPVAYDNLSQGHREAVRWGPLAEGDILDPDALAGAFATWRPDAVMHFAGAASVAESIADPAKYQRQNVDGSRNLVEAMRHAGVKPLVFSSTAAVYGVPLDATVREDHPLAPVNPYGESKLRAERLFGESAAAQGPRAISLRYFNAAGADPDAETGEWHEPETHLVPLALETAAGRRAALTIHGDRHPTPDGTCIRDYVHVADLAQAHVLALQALAGGHAGGAYNLGNGNGFSVREVIDAARRVTGRPIAVEIGPPRAGDPPQLVADAARARADLGWAPRWPGLDGIVASAWAWHQRLATVP